MEVTIRIKLINRFKPIGIPDYKKNRSMKLPVRARTTDEDSLNIFARKLKNIDPDRLSQSISEEITRIKELANFQIKRDPDYGDKLIGKIDVWEYDDWSFTCYIPVSSNKNGSSPASARSEGNPEKVEDKSQLKLFEY
jgi:hypothetical protein